VAPAIRLAGITKRFPGVVALHDVSFEVASGTCHAICGENGAGKSTLGKILAGIERPDAGMIWLDGRAVSFTSPRDALAAGVAMVHQELAFCENLTVAENLCLGKLPARHTFVSRRAMRARARELLATIGATIDPDRCVETLTVAEQQLVQIAAAVGSGARFMIFDEPTSSLSEAEAARLYELIGRLTASGVTILYVSHRMPEIFRLCDIVTVLRDGRHVSTQPIATLDEDRLVQLMIGRRIEQYYPAHVETTAGEEVLRVEGLGCAGRFRDVSFVLRAGEVLGVAGLVGAGRTELAEALFGITPATAGTVLVGGRPTRIRSPQDAMALGIGLVPEDRKRQGLVLSMMARENTTLPTLDELARAGWVRRATERARVLELFDRVRAHPSLLDAGAAGLSGGNQQKLVLAKWLGARSRILILDEPTRGVDVGAKAEMHARIDELAARGTAILLISSELPELLNLSTRILVLRGGRLVGEVRREEASQETILRLMAGLDAPAASPAAVGVAPPANTGINRASVQRPAEEDKTV
jgi:ABC-type sugar transport system ATPase subunit